MAFKDEVREKIPKRLQTRDFKVFSDMITKKSLNSYDKLKSYLNKREIDLKGWIKKKRCFWLHHEQVDGAKEI